MNDLALGGHLMNESCVYEGGISDVTCLVLVALSRLFAVTSHNGRSVEGTREAQWQADEALFTGAKDAGSEREVNSNLTPTAS